MAWNAVQKSSDFIIHTQKLPFFLMHLLLLTLIKFKCYRFVSVQLHLYQQMINVFVINDCVVNAITDFLFDTNTSRFFCDMLISTPHPEGRRGHVYIFHTPLSMLCQTAMNRQDNPPADLSCWLSSLCADWSLLKRTQLICVNVPLSHWARAAFIHVSLHLLHWQKHFSW